MKLKEFPPDYPALSLITSVIRERIRREILAINDDDDDCTEETTLDEEIKAIQEMLPQQIEITGLELLAANNGTDGSYSSDDCSYDSYGADSNPLAAARFENSKLQSASPKSRNVVRRKLSDLSAASLSDMIRPITRKEGKAVSKSCRLSAFSDHSDESEANDEDAYGYGRQPLPHCDSPTKSGEELRQQSGLSLQRRCSTSNYSDYAGDSVYDKDSSEINSYANDSVEAKLMKKTNYSRLFNGPKDHFELKRTVSGETIVSLNSTIDTATINTGGYVRAA